MPAEVAGFSQSTAGEFHKTPIVFYLLRGQSTISSIACGIEIFTDFSFFDRSR
jgi:hypothetical protein